jgi:bacteriocin-like protein
MKKEKPEISENEIKEKEVLGKISKKQQLTEEEMKSIKGGTQNRGMFAVSGKSDA